MYIAAKSARLLPQKIGLPLTTIIPLAEIDPQLVEDLLDAAFGEDRKSRTAYKVREGMDVLDGLSIAAVDEENSELIGTINYTLCHCHRH